MNDELNTIKSLLEIDKTFLKEKEDVKEIVPHTYKRIDRNGIASYFGEIKLLQLTEIGKDLLSLLKLRHDNKNSLEINELFIVLGILLYIIEKLSFVYEISLNSYLSNMLRTIYALDEEKSRAYYFNNIDEVIKGLEC